MAKPKDRPLLEATMQNAEAAFDLATDNEAVRAIPIIGTAFKVAKGIDDLRSRAFAAKLANFVTAKELQTAKARDKLKNGIAESPEEAQKLGESLFLVLERMTDMEKPALLARLFAGYLDDRITSIELRRLAQAVDSAFVDDLKILESWSDKKAYIGGLDLDEDKWRTNLLVTGLTGTLTNQLGQIENFITELGRCYRRALGKERKS
ncbi:MAG TPA: hypothetical protein VHB46_10485 [Burkholderiales bacterium]|nr:hypothetical protein [Burkholderiales bacterium]